MTHLHELTELFKIWAITETEYRDALTMAGCPIWLANELVTTEMQARWQSMKHEKDTVYG